MPIETLIMLRPNGNHILDRSGPSIKTTASSVVSQDGIEKYATGKNQNQNQNSKIKICKSDFTIGTWNVHTLYKTGKIKELERGLHRYTWNIIGLAETRYTGCGKFVTDEEHKVWFSGEQHLHERGAGFIVNKNTIGSILECTHVSSRIITIRVKGQPLKMSIIQIYTPTSEYDDNDIELFYQELIEAIQKINGKDILIIQGDWNAKIGKDAHENWHDVVGKFGLEDTNDRGTRLLEFAKEHKLVVANTLFGHKKSRTVTWNSPGGVTHNQIDFILIQKRYQSGINGTKTRVFPGADIDSDHELLMMTTKLKLRVQKKDQITRIKYYLEKLKDPKVLKDFQATIGGRFAPLLLLQEKSPDDLATQFEKSVQQAASKHLGKKRNVKKPWITADVLMKCDKRKELKKHRFINEEAAQKYREANNKLNKEIALAKESWINHHCSSIEDFYQRNNVTAAFETVKQLTSEFKPKCSVVEDKKGKLLTKPDEVTKRWRQYCEELYNHNANTSEECLEEIDLPLPEIEESPIIRSKIEEALKKLKCNKAPGTDNMPAELLKSGGDIMIEMLLKICNTTFKTGEWPMKWTESIVIPLPKKGNIRKCENNRTIGLISHPSKVLLYVLLNRMTPTIKRVLHDAQAGFQQGRSTTEQFCNLRILSEKYLEHQKPLYHNFIDFKKAFDRVWHKALWKVMRKYNINNNIICTSMLLYDHAKSLVLVAGKRSNWFTSKVGVRQGCVLSPYLFNLFLEFIMTEALDSFDGDVKVNGRIVSNLRFANDIDLIASCEDELRDLTERLDTTARKYGMEINGEKSKVMVTARKEVELNEPITVSNQELKQVNCFKYLGSQINSNRNQKPHWNSNIYTS